MFWVAQVRRATVMSSRLRVAFSTKGTASLEKKKYQGLAITSRREAVTRFVTDLEAEKNLRASSRRL